LSDTMVEWRYGGKAGRYSPDMKSGLVNCAFQGRPAVALARCLVLLNAGNIYPGTS
jgi:hypothetical protein